MLDGDLQSWPKLLGQSALPPFPRVQCWDIELSVRWGDPALCVGRGISSSYMISVIWEWSTEFVVKVLVVTGDYEAAFQLILTRVIDHMTHLLASCTTPMEREARADTVSASSCSRWQASTIDWPICVASLFTLSQYLPTTKAPDEHNHSSPSVDQPPLSSGQSSKIWNYAQTIPASRVDSYQSAQTTPLTARSAPLRSTSIHQQCTLCKNDRRTRQPRQIRERIGRGRGRFVGFEVV